jgi:uncharacterized MAPEG superfamily protein
VINDLSHRNAVAQGKSQRAIFASPGFLGDRMGLADVSRGISGQTAWGTRDVSLQGDSLAYAPLYVFGVPVVRSLVRNVAVAGIALLPIATI